MNNKQEREFIASKTNNRCAYCGEPLEKGWHVDHIEPILRRITAHSELDVIDNKFASCPSCNVNKRAWSVEEFRNLLEGFIYSLNNYTATYKMAKKYGLVEETDKDVIFYFETLGIKPKPNKEAKK